MNNNTAIGINALINATTAENCLCIGENAGFDILDEKGQVRIGNFSDEEVKSGKVDDCFLFQSGKIIIKKDVFEFLRLSTKELEEQLLSLTT